MKSLEQQLKDNFLRQVKRARNKEYLESVIFRLVNNPLFTGKAKMELLARALVAVRGLK